MKLKTQLKALAAAVAIAVAPAANAAWTAPNNPTTGGSLFLVAWGQVGDTLWSYARNLGLLFSNVVNLGTPGVTNSATGPAAAWNTPGFSFSNAGDSLFSSTFVSPSSIEWHVIAAESIFGPTNPGFLVSTMAAVSPTPGNGPSTNAATDRVRVFMNNLAGIGCTGLTASCATSNTSSSAHGATMSGGFPIWEERLGNFLIPGNDTTGNAFNTPVDFYFHRTNGTTTLSTTTRMQYAGQWTLSADGTATYSVLGEIPLPAAAWLFGSGLLGLFAVARRRKPAIA